MQYYATTFSDKSQEIFAKNVRKKQAFDGSTALTTGRLRAGHHFSAICAIKKGPHEAGLSVFANLADWLGRCYVVCAWAFFALSELKINLLVFTKLCVACCLDFRMVDEQIAAAVIRSDKPITFVCIEPFYCTCTHCYFSLAFL
jgi:hypothetical protein